MVGNANTDNNFDDLLHRSAGSRNVAAPRLLAEAIELRADTPEDLLRDLFDPTVESVLPNLEIV
jgi:hypothetical protein